MRSPTRPKKSARLAHLRLEALETRQLLSGDVLPTGSFQTVTGLIARPVAAPTGSTGISATVGPLAFGVSVAPAVGTAVSGPYFPSQIRHAYGVDQLPQDGTGQTIAIVDAYDSPNIAADLAYFDTQFNLPAANLIKAEPELKSGQTLAADSGWDLEIALDVEWAHAIAPGATILLVEANSSNDSDLLGAVDYAVSQGASQVSMSWGGDDFAGVTSYDTHFNHPGVSFFASAGDSGAQVEFPAVSSYVTGVGGTSISLDSAGNKLSETTWSGSGGGISTDVSKPTYQAGFLAGTGRGVPDVSYDADPNSGVYVRENGGWYGVGGTSAGAPQWAGLAALVNQGRKTAGLSPIGTGLAYGTNTALYNLAGGTSYTNAKGVFTDITTGSNGNAATAGYDPATGLGTPVANLLVPALISYGTTTTPPATPIEVDAGSAGFSTVGNWVKWAGYGHNGGLDEEAMPGDGTSKADFTFTGLSNTQYAVQVTWPTYANRATNTPYTIADGSTTLATFPINQQVSPTGTTDANGTTWQQLGILTDTSGTLKVEISNLANGRVEADAVRLIAMPGATPTITPPSTPTSVEIDAGAAGFSTAGTWAQWAGYGHAGGLDEEAMPGNGSSVADYSFTNLTNTQYAVQITWPAYSNRATNTPYTIYNGTTSLGTYLINQQASPTGTTDAKGTVWQQLGIVNVNAGALTVEISNLANGRVEADAVRLVPMPGATVTPPPTGGTQSNIISAGNPGFSTVGPWALWQGYGHNGGLDEEAMPGDGTAKADFAYTGLAPGKYTVAITWPAYSNRATNTPYTILDGSTNLGTFSINRQASPTGTTDATGTTWQTLSTVTVGSDGLLTVELSNLANGRVEADAVMIQPVTSSVAVATTPAPSAGVQFPGATDASASAAPIVKVAQPRGPRFSLGSSGTFARTLAFGRVADDRRSGA